MNVLSQKAALSWMFAQNTLPQEEPARGIDLGDPALWSQVMQFAKMGKMTAGLMHDLGNRLTVAMGFLTVAMKDLKLDSAEREEYLRTALNSLSDALQLMASVKGEMTQEQGLHKVPSSINEIAETAAQKVEQSREFDLSRIRMNRQYDLCLPKVMAHPVQLERVFINLIRNACQAMLENGGDSLLIKTFMMDGNVYVLLRDSGPGLPATVLQNLGTPFNSTRADCGGTGLGLMVVCDIVKAHDGKILARNLPFRGAEFAVTFPLKTPAQPTFSSSDRCRPSSKQGWTPDSPPLQNGRFAR